MTNKHDAEAKGEVKEHEKTVEVGPSDIVFIDKIYGPLVMTQLKIYLDIDRAEWVIEREVIPLDGTSHWEVCARIDGQNSITFPNDK